MRSAPSVSYPVGRSRFGACLLAGLWLTGLAAGLAWLVPGPVDGWRGALWAGVVAACAAWGWRWYVGQAHGQLIWDGAAWRWHGGLGAMDALEPDETDQVVSLGVALDLQRVLLVRCVTAGRRRSRWLWLESGADAARWRALRRAVYSPAPHEPPAQPLGGASLP